MKTTLKGAFAKRKPGLSTAKGRSPKLSLDSKRGPVGYYKGNRVGPQGRRTPLGTCARAFVRSVVLRACGSPVDRARPTPWPY